MCRVKFPYGREFPTRIALGLTVMQYDDPQINCTVVELIHEPTRLSLECNLYNHPGVLPSANVEAMDHRVRVYLELLCNKLTAIAKRN